MACDEYQQRQKDALQDIEGVEVVGIDILVCVLEKYHREQPKS